MSDIVRKYIEPQKENLYYTDLTFNELLNELKVSANEDLGFNEIYNVDLSTDVNVSNLCSITNLGLVNEYELYDLRVQIKNKYESEKLKCKFSGYFFVYNNILILMNIEGRCNNYPNGFFDSIDKYLFELV